MDDEDRSWGNLTADWASYGLRLLNCEDNHYALLKEYPTPEQFKRDLEYRDLNTILNEDDCNG